MCNYTAIYLFVKYFNHQKVPGKVINFITVYTKIVILLLMFNQFVCMGFCT